MKINQAWLQRVCESAILFLAAFVVLWKGGKSLETTWMLAILASFLPFAPKTSKRPGRMVVLSACTFLALGVLSQFTSSAFNYGWDEIIRDAGCVFVFLFVVRSADDGFAFRFSRVLTAIATVACIVGIAIYAYQPVSRFVGTFLDWRFHTDYWPNAWADFLLLAWPCAAYALRRRPVVLGAVLGLMLGCLFLSFSRAGILAFAGQLAILTVFGSVTSIRMRSWPGGETVGRWLSVAGLTLFVGIVTFIGCNALRSSHFSLESVTNKATFSAAEGTSSISERREFWNAAVQMIRERPILGWGPYSFRFVQPRYQTAVLATSDHPHNLFLKIAAERGLPSLLAYSVLVLGILASASWRLLNRTQRGENLPWQPLAITSVLGVVLHSLVDYNLQFVAIALPFWIILATIAPVATTKKAASTKWLEKAAAVLLLVFALWEGIFLVTSSLARRAHAQGDDVAALAWYSRSWPQLFRRDSDLSLAEIHLSHQETEQARASIRRSISLNAQDARGWLFLGNLQESQKEWDAALAAYERTWQMGRFNILNALSGLLRVQVARSRFSDLKRHQDEYLALFTAFAEAIERNTHFIAISRTVEELEHAAGYLVIAYPAEADRIAKTVRSARKHADEERLRFGQQPTGFLW